MRINGRMLVRDLGGLVEFPATELVRVRRSPQLHLQTFVTIRGDAVSSVPRGVKLIAPKARASADLRGDWEVVAAAVSNHGSALQFASEPLRGDRAVVTSSMAEETLGH